LLLAALAPRRARRARRVTAPPEAAGGGDAGGAKRRRTMGEPARQPLRQAQEVLAQAAMYGDADLARRVIASTKPEHWIFLLAAGDAELDRDHPGGLLRFAAMAMGPTAPDAVRALVEGYAASRRHLLHALAGGGHAALSGAVFSGHAAVVAVLVEAYGSRGVHTALASGGHAAMRDAAHAVLAPGSSSVPSPQALATLDAVGRAYGGAFGADAVAAFEGWLQPAAAAAAGGGAPGGPSFGPLLLPPGGDLRLIPAGSPLALLAACSRQLWQAWGGDAMAGLLSPAMRAAWGLGPHIARLLLTLRRLPAAQPLVAFYRQRPWLLLATAAEARALELKERRRGARAAASPAGAAPPAVPAAAPPPPAPAAAPGVGLPACLQS